MPAEKPWSSSVIMRGGREKQLSVYLGSSCKYKATAGRKRLTGHEWLILARLPLPLLI